MSTLTVVAAELSEERAVRLVARRALLPAARHLLRVAPPRPEPAGRAYWPVVLLKSRATVKLPFRRPCTVGAAVAMDAVTGRCGLVDVDLPQRVERCVTGEVVLPPSFTEPEIRTRWREYFRDYLVRTYRPSAIERMEVVELERCHLPYQVVRDAGRCYLVDELMSRVDPVDQLRHVRDHFRPQPAERAAVTA